MFEYTKKLDSLRLKSIFKFPLHYPPQILFVVLQPNLVSSLSRFIDVLDRRLNTIYEHELNTISMNNIQKDYDISHATCLALNLSTYANYCYHENIMNITWEYKLIRVSKTRIGKI